MHAIYYVLSTAWKDIQLLAKDRGALGVYFLLPLLVGVLSAAPSAMSLKAVEAGEAAILVDVALVNLDSGDFGTQIAKALQDIQELAVTSYSIPSQAEEQVANGEKRAAILIPADFSQKIDAYQPVEIEVMVDPAQPESGSIVTGIMNQVVSETAIWGEVQYGIRSILDASGLLASASAQEQRAIQAQNLGVIMTRMNEIRRNPAIAVVSEELAGAKTAGPWQITFIAYSFAGFTVMFIFFIVGGLASSLLDERETGVLRRLVAAPIPRGALIAGKMLAFTLLVCLQVILLFGVANIAFDVSLGKSPAGLAVMTIAIALVATSLGVLLAALAKTSKQAGSLGVMLGFVLAGISGAVAINPGMMFFQAEGFMGLLSRLTPHGHAVKGFYSLMAEDATFMQVLPQAAILVGMSVIFFLIARWRFKFIE